MGVCLKNIICIIMSEKFGLIEQIGLNKEEFQEAILNKKDKRYCILIWLKKPQKIKPFKIDKTGYGTGSAWLTVDNINLIRILR